MDREMPLIRILAVAISSPDFAWSAVSLSVCSPQVSHAFRTIGGENSV